MSGRSGGRVQRGGAIVAAAAMCLVACERPLSGADGGAPDGDGGVPAVSSAAEVAVPRAAARTGMAVLGPVERRVPLLVVPGDALVEVDGQTAYRRDGAIDIVGKVGDQRWVRVWKGAKAAEKPVLIQENQPSPPVIDLNEALPPRPAPKAPKRPARFGGFDDG
ncbi:MULTISPECIES: hypothetical protein [Sorangium]|uniref:Uncharacterized protein n=1 Tax=Sorangium cellulosum TaxID=56 RepID=A0A4P2R0C3_SORCE|nr:MULTISPECIES: hypothetical protein [Sorangium]AUX36285.1 uncharacterized protein SOCE836_084920 [Sorangium cellulosum]WCQ95585.1 hypothetical protein NQZ70_08362 [Sorangium sp. Soce836]